METPGLVAQWVSEDVRDGGRAFAGFRDCGDQHVDLWILWCGLTIPHVYKTAFITKTSRLAHILR